MADAPAPNPAPAPAPRPGPHDRQALLQAYQDVVRTGHDRDANPPPPDQPPSRGTFWVVMGLIVAVLAGVLVLQLRPAAPEESRELREASLRVRMYVEIDRIEQFRSTHERLPTTLTEAGADTTGLSYSPGADDYSLAGVNRDLNLTYTSAQSPRAFLGTSYQLLAKRRQR